MTVLDSLSGVGLADSATGTVATRSYQDSLHRASDSVVWGGNQLGIYTVMVQRPGYADWIREGVTVSQEGDCGNVIPVELVARLARVP